MNDIQVEIKGIMPLIMNNPRSANPLGDYARELKPYTAKKKKTDADHKMILRLKWEAAIYIDPKIGPYIPGLNMESCIIKGATRNKLGSKFKFAFFVTEEKLMVKYVGPKEIDKLYTLEAHRFEKLVKVGMSKVLTSRPIFPEWKLSFTCSYDPDIVNLSDVEDAIKYGGRAMAIGDYRPRYGRFVLTKFTPL